VIDFVPFTTFTGPGIRFCADNPAAKRVKQIKIISFFMGELFDLKV
jgi:hypothetical protein